MTICNSWFFLSSSFCSLQQRDGKKQNKNTLNALFLFPWLVRLKKKQEKLKHSVEYWSTPFNERTLIMSSRWVSERALTASGSSSTIVDRSWAMILSLAWSSLHKCLVSLLASDSNDEQVDVLSPRWLGRMVAVAADCRLVLGNKKRKWKKTQSASVQICSWLVTAFSITYLRVLLVRHVQLLRATLGFIWTLSESRSLSLITSDENSASPKSSPWPESRHSNSSFRLIQDNSRK